MQAGILQQPLFAVRDACLILYKLHIIPWENSKKTSTNFIDNYLTILYNTFRVNC